ncbi:MAG: hypothetical protein A2Z20_03885 [Bdellovibrionales bacterium RBG_16_40_8]|nr:MAG: hypothetical protein A2Z20_03885 [Bdellovibrionales bacterium RBG_16_40_8]
MLITGGTKGLGFATAKIYAEAGAKNIFLSYLSDKKTAIKAQKEIIKLGAECEIIACDLSEPKGAEELFFQLEKKSSRLDVYIHNAAATAFKNLLDMKSHHIDKTFNITLKSFILGVQQAVKIMPKGGAIVTVSGMDTLKAVPGHGLLGAAKSALEMLTRYYAQELAAKKISVNCVNPGFFDSESTRKYFGKKMSAACNNYSKHLPAGRMPTLDEIAGTIVFLSSTHASWIFGQTIYVDGGADFSFTSSYQL